MRALNKVLAPLQRKVMQLFRAATVLRVNDKSGIQMVQVETMLGEIIEVPRIQDFGFTSNPVKSAKAVVAAMGANTNGYVVLKVDDGRYRMTELKPGEAAMYDSQGQFIHLKEGGIIEITGLTQLVAKVPNFRVEGNLDVTGEVTDQVDTGGLSMSGMRGTYNDHDHDGDSGGSTSTPNQEML